MTKACVICGDAIVFKGIRGGRNAKTCSKRCRRFHRVKQIMAWQATNKKRYLEVKRVWRERRQNTLSGEE